jgi:hypothetical protein
MKLDSRRVMAVIAVLLTIQIPQAWAQGAAAGLRVTIKEGDGALNNIRAARAKEPVVVVTDADNRPIKGAAVVFILPEMGASGLFPTGSSTTVSTDENGIAIGRGLRPNNVVGPFEIRAVASYNQMTGRAILKQTNVAPAKSGGGGKTALILALVGGGGAAVALGVVKSGGKSTQNNPSTSITVGGSTFGPPR